MNIGTVPDYDFPMKLEALSLVGTEEELPRLWDRVNGLQLKRRDIQCRGTGLCVYDQLAHLESGVPMGTVVRLGVGCEGKCGSGGLVWSRVWKRYFAEVYGEIELSSEEEELCEHVGDDIYGMSTDGEPEINSDEEALADLDPLLALEEHYDMQETEIWSPEVSESNESCTAM